MMLTSSAAGAGQVFTKNAPHTLANFFHYVSVHTQPEKSCFDKIGCPNSALVTHTVMLNSKDDMLG